jgi:hypothetical protein
VHGNNARVSVYSYPSYTQTSKKCFVFLIIAYVFSSTKFDIRAEQVLPGREKE